MNQLFNFDTLTKSNNDLNNLNTYYIKWLRSRSFLHEGKLFTKENGFLGNFLAVSADNTIER